MQARLGFSIATAWVPDILILDEVLSVGDATFTQQCEERIRSFHDAGATVLMVSHATQAILKNCTRCIWLDDGQMKADGEAPEVVNLYLREHGTEPGEHAGGRVSYRVPENPFRLLRIPAPPPRPTEDLMRPLFGRMPRPSKDDATLAISDADSSDFCCVPLGTRIAPLLL